MIGRVASIRARLNDSPLAHRFLSGAGWSLAGTALSQGMTLLTMLFVARLLGKEIYGQFVLIQSTLNTIGIFAGFGIGQTATRYIAAMKQRDAGRLGHILALSERIVFIFGTVVSVGLSFLSQQLAEGVLHSPELAAPLAIASFAVFFSTLDGYQKSTLIGLESMRAYALGSITGVTLGMPIMLLAARHYGLAGAAGALVASTILQAGISRYLATREMRRLGIYLEPRGCLKEWQVLRDFALPALLSGALVTPAHWVCQAMLANTDNGYKEIALLGVAMQWFGAILFLPNISSRVILPMLTDYVTAENHANVKRILILAIKTNMLMTLPLVAAISVLSPWILSLYGPDFRDGYLVLTIAVITATLVGMMTPVGNLIAARSMMWLGMTMNLGWASIYVCLSYLSLNHGALGIIGALCVAYLSHSVWTVFWTRRQIW